jgi:hypothetical protein
MDFLANFGNFNTYQVLLRETEKLLETWKHPDPYRAPTAPGGNKWERNLPARILPCTFKSMFIGNYTLTQTLPQMRNLLVLIKLGQKREIIGEWTNQAQ